MHNEELHDQASEKTEQPSERQRQESRKKGRVVRSKEAMIALPFLLFLVTLDLAATLLGESLARLYQFCLGFGVPSDDQASWLISRLQFVFSSLADILLFLFVILCASTSIAAVIPAGFLFSPHLLAPQWSRISPSQGLKKLFSQAGVAEVTKATLKTIMTSIFLLVFLSLHINDIFLLEGMSLQNSVSKALSLLFKGGLYLAFPLIVIALIDTLWQVRKLTKEQLQTRQQSKETLKNEEGSLETRGRIQRVRQELSSAYRKKMLESVAQADVIITNPSHFAVALKYESRHQAAPVVIAKGVDFLAEQIIGLGRKAGKPIFVQPQLARVLYYQTRVDQEISPQLYTAVAQVIVYLYQLNRYHEGDIGYLPKKPRIKIPGTPPGAYSSTASG